MSKAIAAALAVLILVGGGIGAYFYFENDDDDSDSGSFSKEVDATCKYETFPDRPFHSFNTCGDRKVIALTFDDGPDLIKTPNVLRELKKAGVRATFFVSPANGGAPTPGQCSMIHSILTEGHSIQSHSWDHQNFMNMTNDEAACNLKKNVDWIEECAGDQKDKLSLTQFRPPFGDLAKSPSTQPQFMSTLGYTLAGWNIDSEDSKPNGGSASKAYSTIVQKYHEELAGDSLIVLMHDKHYSSSGTEGLVGLLVNFFKNENYQFVTTEECFNGCSEYGRICEKPYWPRWHEL